MENKKRTEREKSNLEMALAVAWQAFYLCWLVYHWGHKIGLAKGIELGKVEATAGNKPPIAPIKTEK